MRLLQRLFHVHPLGDIQSVADDVWSGAGGLIAHVAVHPDALLPRFRDQAHEPAIRGLVLETCEIGLEERLHRGSEELPQIPPPPFRRPVAQRLSGRRVDRQQRAIQGMHTNQPEAVLHYVVIPLCLSPHGHLGLPLLRCGGFQLGNPLAQRREVLEELGFRLFGRCHGSPPITHWPSHTWSIACVR